MEKVRAGPYVSTISLFANAVFLLFLLVAFNWLLKRIRRSWAFTQAELLLVNTMVAVGTALAGHDMMPILVQMIPHAFWFGTKENQWMEMFGEYIPRWLTVSDLRVIEPFYEGNSSLYQEHILRAWIGPTLWWCAFVVALGVIMICLSVLVRNLWVERERLTYPIIELPLQMTKPEGGLWRNKLLWLGFLIAGGIDLFNGFAFLYPSLPVIDIKHTNSLTSGITVHPWNALGWMPISFYPFAIGLGYLLPVDLLFSCWFFYLFFKLQGVAGAAFGWDSAGGFPFVREQGYGAYMAILVILIYNGRKYLREVLRRAAGLSSELDDSKEGLSYRACLVLMGLASGFILWFIVKLGMSLLCALVVLVLYFAFSLVITRIRAELGPPVHDQHFSGPDAMITQALGTEAFSTKELAAINWLGWFNRAYRSHPMPVTAEGLKCANVTASSRRKFIIAMLIAFALGSVSVFWASLHSAYEYGANAKMYYGTGFGWEFTNRLAGWISDSTAPNMAANQGVLFGFLSALGLGILRNQFFGFPFHPIGFAISGSWAMNLVWMPLFFAWVIKSYILRYGGLRLYRVVLPFFLGLILGQCVIGSFWGFVGLIFGIPTYSFWGS